MGNEPQRREDNRRQDSSSRRRSPGGRSGDGPGGGGGPGGRSGGGPRDESSPLRLQLFLARAGVASRRKCEQIIASGRVQVNGEVVREQGVKVDPEADEVRLDGKPIRQARRYVYFALNKPPGYLTSNSDPEGRPLAIELVRDAYSGRLFSVGRLDYLSSGLIFFTNDGRFADRVAHPSSQIEKEYQVETRKPIPEELLKRWKEGIEVEGERYHLKSYSYRHAKKVHLVLEEGKNREIRTVFHAHNLSTKKVHRIRIGPITLSDLGPGALRSLSGREVEALLREARRNRHGSSN